jgi:hypothetical protein
MPHPKYRALAPDELAALQIFAAENGRGWKEKLNFVYWFNARIYRDRAGNSHYALHRLRNDLGPSWLAGFALPKREG